MTKTIIALPNQSLLDMILTEYGTLEAGMQVAAANNIDISNIPLAGHFRRMPEVTANALDIEGTTYLRGNSVVIGTLSPSDLGFVIVLKPRMHAVPNVVSNPHTVGYYSFDLKEAPGFIHTNPLEVSYLSDNRVHYQSEERYVLAHPVETAPSLSATAMPAISIPYKLMWTVGLGYMLAWSDLTQPVKTVTYRDNEGNEAYCAPVTVLDNTSQSVIEHFMGDITVELVSSTTTAVVLRLRRSHPAIVLVNFSNHSMEWLAEATGGTADPLDPSNPNKKIITLGAGVHTIGMKTNYYFPGGAPAYPSSAFTMVIKVQ